ncbi:MAG: nitroreductase family deazaflavin-dependent oxidoreductase [Actinobacteria bacterium]|nr:nitroreductase family deazaflavin-dependent oxidoreductase [Actinomycetota bacterium]
MTMGWLAAHAAVENCYVTTKGRRTGRSHEVEIWFGVIDDTLYLISGNGTTADWYLNSLANPQVTVRIEDEVRTGVARDVTDAVERRTVGELMGTKYPWDGDASIGLTFEMWCFEVPLLAITDWAAL